MLLKNMCIGFDVCVRLGGKCTAAFYCIYEMMSFPPLYSILHILWTEFLQPPSNWWELLASFTPQISNHIKENSFQYTEALWQHYHVLFQENFLVVTQSTEKVYMQGVRLCAQVWAAACGTAQTTKIPLLSLILCLKGCFLGHTK